MEREPYELLPDCPPSSSMEMETFMKRPEVALEDAKDADKWKTKALSMLETKFASIVSKSSTDVSHINLHTVDLQVSEGNPVFVKQYTIPLKYQNYIDKETKRLEEAGLISRSLSNWSAPCMVIPKKQDTDKPNQVQLRMVIDYRQLNKRILTSRAPDRNGKAIGQCSDFAAKYLDDIIVFSRTVEDHVDHLEKVFTALQRADLKTMCII